MSSASSEMAKWPKVLHADRRRSVTARHGIKNAQHAANLVVFEVTGRVLDPELSMEPSFASASFEHWPSAEKGATAFRL